MVIVYRMEGIFGGMDFSDLKIALESGENAPMLCYGNFITGSKEDR